MIRKLREVLQSYKRLETAWQSENKNTDEYLAATSLFESSTYRLLETAKRDPLIGFRLLRRTASRITKRSAEHNPHDSSANSLIISGTLVIRERVVEYIRRSAGAHVHSYLAKDVMSLASKNRFTILFRWLPFAFYQALRCLWDSRRANLALTIAEVVEIAAVLHFTEQNKIAHVYDFVPYEVDSNFMYLMLRNRSLTVTKIPSSGPLATHHRILLSDQVVLSTPYQKEECVKFKDTIRTQNFISWPPERAFQYFNRYSKIRPQPPALTIGFYSHGEWLRKEEKHSVNAGRIAEAEAATLQYLGDFVRANPQYRLFIFPHPKETREDLAERTRAHYHQATSGAKFEMPATRESTPQTFDRVDIAVAAFSTIMYERLFCGYKTLIGNMSITAFPLNGSSLNNICFSSYARMQALINEYGPRDEEYFFDRTGLDTYRAKYFPAP